MLIISIGIELLPISVLVKNITVISKLFAISCDAGWFTS